MLPLSFQVIFMKSLSLSSSVRCKYFLSSSSLSSSSSIVSSFRRHEAIQQFFQYIENKYGGNLPMDSGTDIEVLHSDRYIHTNHLMRLMNHKAIAIHVHNFYPYRACIDLSNAIMDEMQTNTNNKNHLTNWKISTGRGLESSDVLTLGEHVPYNIAVAQNKQKEYFIGVQKELRTRRIRYNTTNTTNTNNNDNDITQQQHQHQQQPQLWPLDLLRLQLDETWMNGAGLARRRRQRQQHTTMIDDEQDQQCCFVFGGGLTRIMQGPTRWKDGYIHVDEMAPLSTNRGLFSANIYLQLPSESETTKTNTTTNNTNNTEKDKNNDINKNTSKKDSTIPSQNVLDIWPLGIRNRWDWYKNAITLSGLSIQDSLSQSILRTKLGKPITMNVQPGDLILLSVQRPHAAIGFPHHGSTRISLQCFIQYNGMNERLFIDC